jgi:hypothetical protein
VFRRLVHNGTRLTPTLTVHQLADMPQDVALEDPRFSYVPADLLAIWEWSRREVYMKDRTPRATPRSASCSPAGSIWSPSSPTLACRC